jgi:DNA-binding PadR family transcriptional regulator
MFHRFFNHDHSRRFARGEYHGERGGEHSGERHESRHHRHRHGGAWSETGERDLRRFFAHGDLRLVMLRLIEEKPRHGYEIIKEIEDRVGGAYSPSPGVIYTTLTLLEELGHVSVMPGEGARKLHTITDEGRALLIANRQAVDALFARMDKPRESGGDRPAPRVVRAARNLRMAVRMRLARGALSPEQVDAITEILDAAAVNVERI